MNETAILSLILPVDKEAQAMDLIKEHHLSCRRLTRVKPTPQKPAKRVLLELSFLPGKCHEDKLSIEMERRHEYSDQFKSLTEKFYLGEGDW